MQSDPDEEIASWWSQEYPAITDATGVRQAILDAGYRVVDSFVLPAETWWNEYYSPMEARIPGFLAQYQRDEIALEIAAAAEQEISMFRRFGDAFSYAFFVVRPGS